MAFSDIVQGIQFFSGLSQGFSKQLQDQQKLNDANNLHLLTLLDKDKTHSIEQVDPDEIVQSFGADKLFGTNRPQTKDGFPAFKIGGNYFTAKKRDPIDFSKLFASTESSTPKVNPDKIEQTSFGPAQSSPSQPTGPIYPPPVIGGRDSVAMNPAEVKKKLASGWRPGEATSSVPVQGGMPRLTGNQLGLLPGLPGSPGRPIMETEGGGFSTHRTVTVPVGNLWYEIPAMFGGKEVSEDEARSIMIKNKMVDPETGEKIQGYSSVEEADKAGKIKHDALEQQTVSILQKNGVKPLAGTVASTQKQLILPQGSTEEKFMESYIKKNLPLATAGQEITDPVEARKLLHTLGTEAHKEFVAGHNEVDAKVKDEAKTIHDPALLQLLKSGRIKTREQFAAYEAMKAQLPESQDLNESTARLIAAARANGGKIPRQNVADEYQTLRNRNWTEPDIKHAINASGYDVMEEQEKLGGKQDIVRQGKQEDIRALPASGSSPLDARAMAEPFNLPSFAAGSPTERSKIMKAVAQEKVDAEKEKSNLKVEEAAKKDMAKRQAGSQAALGALDQLDALQKKIFTVPGGGAKSIIERAKQAVTIEGEKVAQPGEGTVSTYEGTSLAHIITIAKALTGTGRMSYAEVLQLQQGLPKLHGAYGILPDSKAVAQNKIRLMRQLVETAIKRPAGTHPIIDVNLDAKSGALMQTLPSEGAPTTSSTSTPSADPLDELKALVPGG